MEIKCRFSKGITNINTEALFMRYVFGLDWIAVQIIKSFFLRFEYSA